MKLSSSTTLTLGLTSLTLLSGAVLSSSLASADDAVDEITITVPTSCSMSSSGNTSHTAEIGNGQSNSTIGETTITTYCNDNEGFAIYAIGYTGDTLGNTVLTDNSLGSTHDIVTGTATSGNTSNWAMKLSTISSPSPNFPIIISGTTSDTLKEQGDPDYSSFQQVPDDYTKVAYRTSSTDVGTNAEGSVLKTTYQTYISPSQSAGTYQGKVKYVLVYPHNGDAPTIPTAFTWQSSSATRPADADVTMIMQDFTTALCAAGQNGQIGWVKDSRDNTVYTIAKLADGKCWMTENLDLAGGTALSADDTDVTSDYISSFTITDLNLAKIGNTIVLPSSATKNSEDNDLTDDTQFYEDNYSYVFNSGNKTNCGAENQDTPCYSYYSWDAATLGSGRDIEEENIDAPYSICPKGWRLPTSGARHDDGWKRGDFYVLASAYGADLEHNSYEDSDTFYNNAGPGTTPNFLLAGNYGSGWFFNDGDYNGKYWSSTSSYDANGAYSFYFQSSYMDSSLDGGRSNGLSVRCLLKSIE